MPTMFKSDLPTRKQVKARADRAEAKVAKAVRAKCVERDEDSRVRWSAWASMGGTLEQITSRPEWAHLHAQRRSKTAGMPPEARHSTQWSLMLPRAIHRLYDAKELDITALTDRGADGPLRFEYRGKNYEEPER